MVYINLNIQLIHNIKPNSCCA